MLTYFRFVVTPVIKRTMEESKHLVSVVLNNMQKNVNLFTSQGLELFWQGHLSHWWG